MMVLAQNGKQPQNLDEQLWQKKHLCLLSGMSQINILNIGLDQASYKGRIKSRNWRIDKNERVHWWQARALTLSIAVSWIHEWCFTQYTGRHLHVIQTDFHRLTSCTGKQQWHSQCKHIWQVRNEQAYWSRALDYPQFVKSRPKTSVFETQ